MSAEKKSNTKNRVTAFLMALVLMFSMTGHLIPVVAGSVWADETTDATGAGAGAHGIFDVVGDDGSITGNGGFETSGNTGKSISNVLSKYKELAVGVMGVLTVTMLIFMLIQFAKLGASGDNDMARKKAIMGILTTGIATALLGGSTIVVGFFWGALK